VEGKGGKIPYMLSISGIIDENFLAIICMTLSGMDFQAWRFDARLPCEQQFPRIVQPLGQTWAFKKCDLRDQVNLHAPMGKEPSLRTLRELSCTV
jgi:hypothetical protein